MVETPTELLKHLRLLLPFRRQARNVDLPLIEPAWWQGSRRFLLALCGKKRKNLAGGVLRVGFQERLSLGQVALGGIRFPQNALPPLAFFCLFWGFH